MCEGDGAERGECVCEMVLRGEGDGDHDSCVPNDETFPQVIVGPISLSCVRVPAPSFKHKHPFYFMVVQASCSY